METLQRGVGVEVCPAEPPLDLESVCERFGGVSRGGGGTPLWSGRRGV